MGPGICYALSYNDKDGEGPLLEQVQESCEVVAERQSRKQRIGRAIIDAGRPLCICLRQSSCIDCLCLLCINTRNVNNTASGLMLH